MQALSAPLPWARAHQLAINLYRLMGRIPPEERYGFGAELCRAAANVPVWLGRCARELRPQHALAQLSAAQRAAAETEQLLCLMAELPLLHQQMVRMLGREQGEIRRAIAAARAALAQERASEPPMGRDL